jgi:hypothetical protein
MIKETMLSQNLNSMLNKVDDKWQRKLHLIKSPGLVIYNQRIWTRCLKNKAYNNDKKLHIIKYIHIHLVFYTWNWDSIAPVQATRAKKILGELMGCFVGSRLGNNYNSTSTTMRTRGYIWMYHRRAGPAGERIMERQRPFVWYNGWARFWTVKTIWFGQQVSV